MKRLFLLGLISFVAVQMQAAIPSTVVFTDATVNNIIDSGYLPPVIYSNKSNPNYDVFQLSVALQSGETCAEHTLKNAVAGIGLFDTYDQLKNCNNCKNKNLLVQQFINYSNLLKGNDLEQHFLNERKNLRSLFSSSCNAMTAVGQNITNLGASTWDPELVAMADNITAIVANFKGPGFANGIPFISPDMVHLQSPNSINSAYTSSLTNLDPNPGNLQGITDTNLLTTVLGFREAQKENKSFRRAMLFQLNDDNNLCTTYSHIMALIIDMPASDSNEKSKPRFIILESHDNANIANNCILQQFIDLLFNENKGSAEDISGMFNLTASQYLSTSPAQDINSLARKHTLSSTSQAYNNLKLDYNWATSQQQPNYALAELQAMQYFGLPLAGSIATAQSNAKSNLEQEYMAYMGCQQPSQSQPIQNQKDLRVLEDKGLARVKILKAKTQPAVQTKNGIVPVSPKTLMRRKEAFKLAR